MAAGHQVVVEADLVAAMLLGVVQGLVGLAQDFHWRPPGRADKAQAHGDLADLRERVLLHRHAETVEHLVGRAQRGRAQQHHELLAAEAEHAVVAAERVAQDVGNQDQHLIAIQMAEAVVDLLEVVDVDHGQPLLHGFAGQHMRVAGEHRRGRIRAADQAMQRVARELLIEGLAVEQAGERVAFAVVEQALVVLIDLKHALEDIELVCRKGARLRDLQAGADLVVHPHRQPQPVAALVHRCQGAVAMVRHAFAQVRVMLQGFAPGVCGGFGVGKRPLAVLHPGARAHMGNAGVGKQLQRPHFDDVVELLQRRQHRQLQPQMVAVAGHLDQVLKNGLHGRHAGQAAGRQWRRSNTRSRTPCPSRRPRFSNLVSGR